MILLRIPMAARCGHMSMTASADRYAASLRLSVAPMMDWADIL
ncbi:hypothetical protein PUV44_12265 [Xanthomonas arboricola pv. corylina]|nr:hypothetical protein PUV44_12265 [Xanthomonas arboricola pv. corylina]